MSKKKLYSFRAAPELLVALREKADEQGTTVSDVIHTILSEALEIPLDSESSCSVSPRRDSMKGLMEQLRQEITDDIRKELRSTQFKQEIADNLREELESTK